MAAGALRKDRNQDQDDARKYPRRDGAAQLQAALVERLVEEIPYRRTQWARQDESAQNKATRDVLVKK